MRAIAAALEAVGNRRRIVVVGCGGDRDPLKREPMGESAARHADVVIATDDNPRSEDPAAIRAQLLAGARAAVRHEGLAAEVIDGGDRRTAINLALQLAAPGDVTARFAWQDGEEVHLMHFGHAREVDRALAALPQPREVTAPLDLRPRFPDGLGVGEDADLRDRRFGWVNGGGVPPMPALFGRLVAAL